MFTVVEIAEIVLPATILTFGVGLAWFCLAASISGASDDINEGRRKDD